MDKKPYCAMVNIRILYEVGTLRKCKQLMTSYWTFDCSVWLTDNQSFRCDGQNNWRGQYYITYNLGQVLFV